MIPPDTRSKPTTQQRSFRYRFYPTPAQESLLVRTFGCVRYVYNRGLETKARAWKDEGRSIGYAATDALLTVWKREPETEWLQEVSSVPLQQAVRHLESAFQRFFKDAVRAKRTGRKRQVGYPQRKRRKVSKDAASFTRQGFRWNGADLWLAKCAEPLSIVWSRPLPPSCQPSMVHVSRDRAGRWHISISVEEAIRPLAPIEGAVGLDLGLESLFVLSDGRKVGNQRHMRREHKRMARAHRAVSRKVVGSENRQKARRRLSLVRSRAADRRRDHLHKLTAQLVRENQTVVIEDLAVRHMLAKGKPYKRGLNRSIGEAGWSELRRQLEYKCEWYGRRLVVVSRWFASSKTCSDCGHLLADLPLNVRVWTCPGCGAVHDRDVNAARNVLAAGLAVIACGHDGSPPAREAVVDEAGSPACVGGSPGGKSRPVDAKNLALSRRTTR